MKIKLQTTIHKRVPYIAASLLLATVSIMSGLSQHVDALMVQTRFIRMSQSSTTAQHVDYFVSFNIASAGPVGGVAIDFCSNSPIIGDSTCTAPTGFNINASTTTVNNAIGVTDLTLDATHSTASTAILTSATAPSLTAGTTLSFDLGNGTTNGITNPSTVGTFYARFYTYSTAAAAQAHNTTSPSGYVDYGGDALSTAAIVNITTHVMEQLTFCVYHTTCGDDPSINIGHLVGSTYIIDSTAVDKATVNFSIATNANGGVSVRMKGDTLKTSAGNALNPAGTTPITFTAGTEDFGMRMSSLGSNAAAVSPYNDPLGTSQYAFDVTSANPSNVTGTYGGEIMTLPGATTSNVSTLEFAATASDTTVAGTYTAAEQLIATGTF